MNKFLFCAALALSLAACSYPTTKVSSGQTRPQIAIANATPSAVLLVNGVMVGAAASYDGKGQTLALDRGTHRIVVEDQGRVVYAQDVYLSDDVLRTITIPN